MGNAMRDTKLVELLQLLSRQQRRRLALFVASPYFNGVPRLAELLEILDQRLLRLPDAQPTEEEVFALLLPGLPYDQNRLRKDCTALLQLTVRFLAQERYAESTPLQAQHRIQALNALEADGLFPGFLLSEKETLAQVAADAPDRLEAAVQLGLEQCRHELRQPGRRSEVEFGTLEDDLARAHLIRRMELHYLRRNDALVSGRPLPPVDEGFLGAVALELPRLPVKTQIYYQLHCCNIGHDGLAYFQAYKALIGQAQLPIEELEEVFTAGINHCARRHNAGETAYLQEMFDLYRAMQARGVFGPERKLIDGHFKNIVVVGCRLGAFEWVRAFVAAHAPALRGDFNRNAANFSQGYIAFMEGDFAGAASWLYRVLDEYEDPHYGVDARVTLLRVYYELEDLGGIDSLSESFRMYIKRSRRLSGQRKANLQAFVRQLRRLAHIPRWDKAALARLRTDIVEGRQSANTRWLLEKVDLLLGPGRDHLAADS